MNNSDNRCCGSGVCIINAAGECWCGQVWNGEEMVSASHLEGANSTQAVDSDQPKPEPEPS